MGYNLNVSDFERVREAVSDYARDYIRALRHRGNSFERIGDELQVSHVYVQQLLKTEKYGRRKVGPKLEQRLADLLHGGSVEALRRAALHLASGVIVIVEKSGKPLDLSPDKPRELPAPSPSDKPRPR